MVKNLPASARDARDTGSIPGSERSPGEKNTTHFSILVKEIPSKRSLVGYSLWGCKELGMTKHTKMI